jgi:Na+/proline symporter
MMHAVVLGMLLAGFACLSLSMTRHQLEVLARPLPPVQGRLLRGLGFVLIAVGLAVAIRALGAGLGTVAWFGYLSLAAGAVFFALLWRRQRPRKR